MKAFLVIFLASTALAIPLDILSKPESPGAPSVDELEQADILAPPSTMKQRMDKGFKRMGKMLGFGGGEVEEPLPPLPPPPAPIVVVYPAYPIKPQYTYAGSYGGGGGGGAGGYGGGGGGYGDGVQHGPGFPHINVLGGYQGMGGLSNLGAAGMGQLGPNLGGTGFGLGGMGRR